MMKIKTAIILLVVTAAALLMLDYLEKIDPIDPEVSTTDSAHTFYWGLHYNPVYDFYDTYDQNPSFQYMLSKKWTGMNGREVDLDMVFRRSTSYEQYRYYQTPVSAPLVGLDIKDISKNEMGIVDLYKNGTILDLSPYVEKFMPNYKAFLSTNPDLKKIASNIVDGKQEYLMLYSWNKMMPDQWNGFCYRRDWIVKYGINPFDGSAFRGEYTLKNSNGSWDMTSWVDNVVFPSGGTDPVYISDWEWMFDIFNKAIQDQGITNGYCMSLYYTGYFESGDLVSAFGGGGGHWYKNPDNKVIFGLTSDNFRTYLQCMNSWFKKGWIDPYFQEHVGDAFYTIDNKKVRQGKVGLWEGLVSDLNASLDMGDEYTKGMVVYAARDPMNDIYGTYEQQKAIPYCFSQQGQEGTAIVISSNVLNKDYKALFHFLDYAYSEEGMLLKYFGLNKEQYASSQNEIYKKNGLTEGAYTDTMNDLGIRELEFVDTLKNNGVLASSLSCNWLFGLNGVPDHCIQVDRNETKTVRHNLDEWVAYTDTGSFDISINSQLTEEEAATISNLEIKIREFTSLNVSNYITGKKDPYNDKDWEDFIQKLNKYKPDTVTQIYQKSVDLRK